MLAVTLDSHRIIYRSVSACVAWPDTLEIAFDVQTANLGMWLRQLLKKTTRWRGQRRGALDHGFRV